MIDLKLPEYRIKEFKYQLKEGKIAIIKLFGGTLDDIEIVEEPIEKHDYNPFTTGEDIEKEKKEFDLNEIMLLKKPKQLHDYEPVSCLRNEKGMQETLEAARHKQWKEDVKSKPQKPSQTGNALFPTENTVDLQDKKFMSKPSCATTNEITTFLKNQKNADLNEDKKFREKHEKKLVVDLLKSKKLIDDYTTKMSDIEKERFLDRAKNNYFKLDPNDAFSKIKTLNDLNNLDANYSSLSSDEPKMKPIYDEAANAVGLKKVGTMKIDRKTDKIIEFTPNKNENELE